MIEDDQNNLFGEKSAEKNLLEKDSLDQENDEVADGEENLAEENDGGKKSVKGNPAKKNGGGKKPVKEKPAKEEFEDFLENNFREDRHFYGYFLQKNFLHQDLQDKDFPNKDLQNKIEEIYGELKGDGFTKKYSRKEIVKKYFGSDLEGATSVCLKSIEDVQDVNALHGGEELFFVKTKEDGVGKNNGGKNSDDKKKVADDWDKGRGLAIVYGDNASGKTGYTRILQSACSALIKDDKNKDGKILPNVYDDRKDKDGEGDEQGDEKKSPQDNSADPDRTDGIDPAEPSSSSEAQEASKVINQQARIHYFRSEEKKQAEEKPGKGKSSQAPFKEEEVYWNLKFRLPPEKNRSSEDKPKPWFTSFDGDDDKQSEEDLKNIKIFDEGIANVFVSEEKELEIAHPSSKALVYLIKVIEQLEKKFDGDIGQKKENDGKKVDVVGGRRDKFKKNFDGSGSGGDDGENFKNIIKEVGKCFYAVEKEITFSDTPEKKTDFVKTFFSILGNIVDLNCDSSEEEKLLADLNSDDAEKSSAPLTTEGNAENCVGGAVEQKSVETSAAISSTASSVPPPSEVKNPQKKLTVKEKLKLLARLFCELKSCCSQSGDQLLKKIKENALQKNIPAEKILLTGLTEKILGLVKDYPKLKKPTAPTDPPEPSTQIAQDQLPSVDEKIVDEEISKGGGGDGIAGDGGGQKSGDPPAPEKTPETPKTSGEDSLEKLKDLVSDLLRPSDGEKKEIKKYNEQQNKDAETIRNREKEKQELKNTFEKQKEIIKGIENHVQKFYGLDNSAGGDVPFLETSMGKGLEEIVSTLQKFISAKETKDAFAEKLKISSEGGDHLEKEGKPYFNIKRDSWTELWKAAKQYSKVAYPEHEFPHTGDDARCVLCQQTLQEEGAVERFEIFKKFFEFLEKQPYLEEQTKQTSYGYEGAKENYKESLRNFFEECEGFLGKDIFKRLSLNSGKDKSVAGGAGGNGGDRGDGEDTIDYLVAKSAGEADGGSWSILGDGGGAASGAPSNGGDGEGENGEVATQSDDEGKKVEANLRGKNSWEIEPAKETAEQSVQSVGASSVNGEAQKGEAPKKSPPQKESPPQNVSLAEAIGYLYDEKLQEDLKTISKLQKELMEKSGDDTQSKSGQDSGSPLEDSLLTNFLKEDKKEAKKDERKNFKEAIETLGEDYEKYFNEKLREPVISFLEKSAESLAAKSAQQPAAKSATDQAGMTQDHQDHHDLNAQKSAELLSEILKKVEEIKIPKFFEKIFKSFEEVHKHLENEKDSKQPAPTALIALKGLSDENFAQKIQKALKKLNEVEELGKQIANLEEKKNRYIIKSTVNITNLSKKINEEMIGEKQKKAFEDTLEKFDLDYIKLKQDIIGEKGTSKSKINFEDRKLAISVNPHDILSEGEFRGVAFAAFFAEMAVRKNKSAIVFDDPVSSMDHNFSGKIADCLVEEAKSRQVIVFTHNQSFEKQLVKRCNKKKIKYVQRLIKRDKNKKRTGIVAETPIHKKGLECYFNKLKTEAEKLEEKDQEEIGRVGAGLRKWIESFIEGYFNPQVIDTNGSKHLNKLDGVRKVDEEDLDKLKEIHKRSHSFHHSENADENPPTPSAYDLKKDFKSLDDIFTRVLAVYEKEKK